MNGTGLRLIDPKELFRLSQAQLDAYERTICAEAARLWADFERVPCDINIGAWRGFVRTWVEPVISEQSWRLIRASVQRTGPGGIEV